MSPVARQKRVSVSSRCWESICNLDFSCQCFLLAQEPCSFIAFCPSTIIIFCLPFASPFRSIPLPSSDLTLPDPIAACFSPILQVPCDWCLSLDKGFLWGSPSLIDCLSGLVWSVCRRHACLRLPFCRRLRSPLFSFLAQHLRRNILAHALLAPALLPHLFSDAFIYIADRSATLYQGQDGRP